MGRRRRAKPAGAGRRTRSAMPRRETSGLWPDRPRRRNRGRRAGALTRASSHHRAMVTYDVAGAGFVATCHCRRAQSDQPGRIRMSTRRGIKSLAVAAALFALPAEDSVHAAEIRVLFPAGLKAATDVLVPQFEKSTGHTTSMSYANIGTITNLVRKREAADIAVVSPQQWESLRNADLFGADLRVRIAHVAVGVAVKKGASRPAVGSNDELRRTLLSVNSVGISNPE